MVELGTTRKNQRIRESDLGVFIEGRTRVGAPRAEPFQSERSVAILLSTSPLISRNAAAARSMHSSKVGRLLTFLPWESRADHLGVLIEPAPSELA